jgi:hypothetical protein
MSPEQHHRERVSTLASRFFRIVIPALLLCSACKSVQFTEQSIFVRHDADRDLAEVLIVYQGLHPSRSTGIIFGESDAPEQDPPDPENQPFTAAQVRKGHETVSRIAAGKRIFVLGIWFSDVDLDSPRHAPVTAKGRGRTEEDVFQDGISVRGSGIFLNQEDQLCAFQVLRIPRVKLGLRLLNQELNEAILNMADSGNFEENFTLFDERTRELWIQEAQQGVPWITPHAGGVRVSFPATPRTAARLLAGALTGISEAEDVQVAQTWAALASCVAGMEITDEHVTFDFRPGKGGEPTLKLVSSRMEYSDEILQMFQERGRSVRRLTDDEVFEVAW